ncbi:hypothetical protein CEXT_787511 [Caerostris extrusa]|uniref:Uncharacterized protein n=1 Tax=Caerostris extrusa TaxID=172846 RepID=A0AAV4VPP2_CAEEX|nr:hypothetical protein CEXT_787511 [Caerostris extrusa]
MDWMRRNGQKRKAVLLKMSCRPIANKYREGKLQRTLKREIKSDTAQRQTGGPSKSCGGRIQSGGGDVRQERP